jgi:hypothetical protein
MSGIGIPTSQSRIGMYSLLSSERQLIGQPQPAPNKCRNGTKVPIRRSLEALIFIGLRSMSLRQACGDHHMCRGPITSASSTATGTWPQETESIKHQGRDRC